MPGFERVSVEQEVPEVSQAVKQNPAAQQMLLLALQQLSKRALAGISAAFSLIGLGSAWYLFDKVLPAPNPPQLFGLGLYCVFLLSLEIIRRRGT